MSTTYIVTGEGFLPESRSDKGKAITLATALAATHATTVEVATNKGTLVHTANAPKIHKRTPRYTRIDSHDLVLAEGVVVPSGYDLAYVRPRVGLALLRRVTKGVDGFTVDYAVFDQATGARVVVGTTREAGSIFAQVRRGELELAV